jgi:3-oxoacyl-[acyl-carrier-protein] synthase-3
MDYAVIDEKQHLVKMAGREVFKAAVRSMADAADQALLRAGLTADDIDLLIPHQANMRIIEATARYANVPMEKVYVNVDRYGNMSSATIPVALDEAVEEGRLKAGDNVLMVAFGAGFTWASGVVRW